MIKEENSFSKRTLTHLQRDREDNDYDRSLFQAGQLKNYVDRWVALVAPLPSIKKPPLILLHNQQVKIAYATLHLDIEVKKIIISQGVLERSRFQTGFVSYMFSTPKPDSFKKTTCNLNLLISRISVQENL